MPTIKLHTDFSRPLTGKPDEIQAYKGKSSSASSMVHLSGKWDARKRAWVYSADNFECCYCGAKQPLSVDHVIPAASVINYWPKPLINCLWNLVTACMPCNSKLRPENKAHALLAYGRFAARPTTVTERSQLIEDIVMDRMAWFLCNKIPILRQT